jgi:hypothetical protein
MATLTPHITATLATTSTQPEGSGRSGLAMIKMVILALSEGLVAHDRYNSLRARGVPHADAARQAFAQN